mmetsp:Transcript_27654/g.83407  ORF Transcript_27654/g.83407 Transcript_27654/m.83407 type:complete len:228 (-) Transcript_27654:2017-2700(-)
MPDHRPGDGHADGGARIREAVRERESSDHLQGLGLHQPEVAWVRLDHRGAKDPVPSEDVRVPDDGALAPWHCADGLGQVRRLGALALVDVEVLLAVAQALARERPRRRGLEDDALAAGRARALRPAGLQGQAVDRRAIASADGARQAHHLRALREAIDGRARQDGPHRCQPGRRAARALVLATPDLASHAPMDLLASLRHLAVIQRTRRGGRAPFALVVATPSLFRC